MKVGPSQKLPIQYSPVTTPPLTPLPLHTLPSSPSTDHSPLITLHTGDGATVAPQGEAGMTAPHVKHTHTVRTRGRENVHQILHCTVLYCTVLYSTVLHSTVLHCTVLYYTVLYSTALYCTTLYCTVLHCILHCTVLYCTVLYYTVEEKESLLYYITSRSWLAPVEGRQSLRDPHHLPRTRIENI